MITNTGKNLIAKYLLNQAPEFASHIAVGIGGNAVSNSSSTTFVQESESLNFEVARVPVLSKGLIKEEGVEKIVFKAQLPTDQRFQITEIGLYPAESNVLAERYNSKILTTFTNSESWTYGTLGSASVVQHFGDIPLLANGDISDTNPETNAELPLFSFVESDSPAFEFPERKDRNEQPRYLSKSLFLFGNSASIDSSFNYSASSYYVENNTLNINMGNNLPTDKIKLAFSVLSRQFDNDVAPTGGARFILEFYNNVPGSPSASVSMIATQSDLSLANGRYKVLEKQISDFNVSPNFSWSNINKIRVYSSIIDSDVASDDYFIALDGIRLENVSTINPLYGLTAAEYVKTQDAYPILKRENSISYIEYRFGVS